MVTGTHRSNQLPLFVSALKQLRRYRHKFKLFENIKMSQTQIFTKDKAHVNFKRVYFLFLICFVSQNNENTNVYFHVQCAFVIALSRFRSKTSKKKIKNRNVKLKFIEVNSLKICKSVFFPHKMNNK